MKIKQLYGIYYSATGNTEKVVKLVGETLKEKLHIPITYIDYTLPNHRMEKYSFHDGAFVLFGTPVYAGRIPNKILPYIQEGFLGDHTPAAALITYGNRSYENAVVEMFQELTAHGFQVTAAAAVVAQHAFTSMLATNRPNDKDERELKQFAEKLANEIMTQTYGILQKSFLGIANEDKPLTYYTPLKEDGTPAVFLKAKPKTDMTKCCKCSLCAARCPMDSISFTHVDEVVGICIKCQACITCCPTQAKYFDDENFLSHVRMLEKNYTQPKDNIFWYAKSE